MLRIGQDQVYGTFFLVIGIVASIYAYSHLKMEDQYHPFRILLLPL